MEFLYDYQIKALTNMKNGCILCGGTGSGKSRTSIAYYFLGEGGTLPNKETGIDYGAMKDSLKDLYIITTAKKRDDAEWEGELVPFLLSTNKDTNVYSNKVTVDSWNNIKKYKDTSNAFFIFDEQRVVGSGTWVNAFLAIAKKNKWILLSATPGDCWSDYIPVFVANGFYKNKTEFLRRHVVYSPYTNYPQIDRYLDTNALNYLRRSILVTMDFDRATIPHSTDVYVDYDVVEYKRIMKDRWNVFEDKPLKNASEFCYCLRKSINSNPERAKVISKLVATHNKVIIFYNFNYELDILKDIPYGEDVEVAEWNGHKHQPLPTSERWVYLVQYSAGSEGWNCITTDTIIFYSQSYSYRSLTQSMGRIDRINTSYIDLYYYHIKSRSGLDLAITKALKNKKNFNESKFSK